jgi:hypothetical protein
VKLQSAEQTTLEEAVVADAPVTQEDVHRRVRRFAVLRAAQRALDPSHTGDAELGVIRGLREELVALTRHFEGGASDARSAPPIDDALHGVDAALDGYSRTLLERVQATPLSQLRASLASESHEERVEVTALLELCLAAERTPSRFLRVVDLLVTMLSVGWRGGRWVVEFDPANLNDVVRNRCWQAGHVDTSVESRIVDRFRAAAERVESGSDAAAVMKEMSAYKVDVASFYFVPAILRCIVGYNVAARNYFEERMRRGRELDAEINDELGSFAPLSESDPRVCSKAPQHTLPPHESPGVLAVQEAIRKRLAEVTGPEGPAERIAARLDLGWLESDERNALLAPSDDGIRCTIRMTVVLGHLAMCLPDHPDDFASLGLKVPHLDAWICELGEEVQSEIDTLIQGNAYDGAVRLGDIKSRFLAAVLLVARRRLGRNSKGGGYDGFDREAIDLVREHLERERLLRAPPMFMDLLGGGWRRTVALTGVFTLVLGLLFVEWAPSNEPRKVRELEKWEARELSSVLQTAYRDHADDDSIFVGTLGPAWFDLDGNTRRKHAEIIQQRVADRGVEEVMLYDRKRVLQAHYAQGEWRVTRGWEP